MKKFFIFSLPRSGSTLLVSLLRSHPAVHVDGEIFHRKSRLSPFTHQFPILFLTYRLLIARWPRRVPVYGFKLLFSQATQPEHFVPRLHALGWDVIHLERLSVFDQAVSGVVAHHTRRFHGRAGQAAPALTTLSIDVEQFMEIVRLKTRSTQRCRSIVATVPHLSVVYERDLVSSDCWQGTVARICAHMDMDMPEYPVSSPIKKPWQRPYREIIVNFDELLAAYEQFSRQPPSSADLV